MPGWSTDADADTLAALSAGMFGLTVKHLAAPGMPPLAVLGEARVLDRFRSGSGGLRLTLAWPAGLRGTAASGARGGPVRHGVAHVGPGEGCVCRRHDCGGVVPVSWCAEHGDAVGPVLEWHPQGGIRCHVVVAELPQHSGALCQREPLTHRRGHNMAVHGLEAVQYRLSLLGYLQVQPGEFCRTTVEPQRVRRHRPYPLRP
ncbi:hypothetical protein OHB39_34380 [Streptomyces sp. NBC_00047]|uniref:hypothetical protein n=1 Tax=Streptomyces sp. NBC_00047 TaxID=2975627 RepID=UPI00225291D2|nr:hypothetical protein [Streptomyces sp. NBC_00047]MCX5612606.1 hypothetical protein [Streptomyces sp. NBC_00047]